jgi:phosphoribosylaminoimidazole carboxylase PurE protein
MTRSVSVLMGSTSDEAVMKVAVETLRGLGVECEMRVLSAHRTPDAVRDYVREASTRGVKVFICGAGGAAHLAGAVAAHTTSPVIGVPLVTSNSIAGGLDALLSTVQMPRGVPVATVAVGEPGAANAGILAAEILATGDDELAGRLRVMREGMAAKVLAGGSAPAMNK